MLVLLFRLLSRVPLAWLQAFGRFLGLLVYALPGRYRDRLQQNAAQAGYASRQFARRAAAETGAAILELPWVWFRSDEALDRVTCSGLEVFHDARRAGKTILFLTPHLGSFELSARYGALLGPITVLFREPRHPRLGPLLEQARARSGVSIAPANLQGVRRLVRALRSGEMVGILPDQVPGAGEGAWAPFFGRDAYTVTLPARLARMPGVAVIGTACERLPAGKGWRLHFMAIDTPAPETPAEQAAWVNTIMENLIRICPHQYLWSYNRYKAP